MYMENELSPEEEAAKLLAEKNVASELSDEDFAALVEKRLGAKPQDLIKKTEQVKVLTEEEKKELQEKEDSEVLKFGIEQKLISKKEYDSYLELKSSNKIDIARKKFIAKNEKLGEEAGKVFDQLHRLEEDDEIEEGEKLVPNTAKISARQWAESIAEEEIEEVIGKKIKGLPEKYKSHVEEQALKKVNADVIAKAITEIPKRLETEIDGVSYGVDLTDDDFAEVNDLVVKEVLGKKGLTAEEVKGVADTYLFAKNAKRLMEEAVKIAYEKGGDDVRRGAKGITEDKGKGTTSSEMREFLKKMDIKV